MLAVYWLDKFTLCRFNVSYWAAEKADLDTENGKNIMNNKNSFDIILIVCFRHRYRSRLKYAFIKLRHSSEIITVVGILRR